MTPAPKATSWLRGSENGAKVDEQEEVGRQSAFARIDAVTSSRSGIA
jgi:hypothetical protein